MLTATALGLRFASAAALTWLIVLVCINVLLPPHTIPFNQLSSWLFEQIGFFAWAWFAFSLSARLVQREFTSTNRLPIFIGVGYALTVPALANLPLGENLAGVCILLIPFVAGGTTAFWLRGTAAGSAASLSEDANCDSSDKDPVTLFKRGSSLVSPYMLLSDRPLPNAQQHAQELRKGIACLDRAIQLRPDYWQAHWVRGKAYQALGEMHDARGSFRSAYALNAENPDVGRELVKAHIDLSEFSEAVLISKRLVDTFPTDAGLRANYALALVLNGQVGAAQTAAADALRLDPADAITRALKGRIDDVANGKRARPRSLDDFER